MAGGIVTVDGASGHHVPVTVNGAQALTLAQQYAATVNAAGSSGNLFATESSISVGPASSSSTVNEFLPTAGGTYTYPDGYNYFTTATSAPVTVDASAAVSADTLNTLVGTGGATYIAGNESGTFIAGGGNNAFTDTGSGNYVIATSDGNDSIVAGNGNDFVNAGTGDNYIALGSGSDSVVSDGSDYINAGSGSDLITLNGGGSTFNAFGGEQTVVDNGSHNMISEMNELGVVYPGYAGSTLVYGGNDGTYDLAGASTVYAGTGNTINLSAPFPVYLSFSPVSTTIHGGVDTVVNAGSAFPDFEGSFSVPDTIQFIAQANTSATVNAGSNAATVTGASGADITYSSGNPFQDVFDQGNPVGMLTSAGGNETLNGGGSTLGFAGFVSNQFAAAGNTTLIGGSGNDTLTAGLGNQTITGGAGQNTFVLSANDTQGDANITITDLGSSANNLVALYGYGTNEVANALATVTVAGGNSTMTLGDQSTVTFLGVTDLKSYSFTGDK